MSSVSVSRSRGQRRKSSGHTVTVQAALGAAGLGFTALACVVTLCGDMAEPRVAQVYYTPPPPSPTFDARFAAVGRAATEITGALPKVTGSQAPAQKSNQYVALFDRTYSLGSPPVAFEKPRVAVDDVAVSIASRAPARPQAVAALVVPEPRAAAGALPRPGPRAADKPNSLNHEIMVQRARATILAANTSKPGIFEKLFGDSQRGPMLAFAGSDGGVDGDGTDVASRASPFDRYTAIYDISAKTVYLPNGQKLEAHSGLGGKLDDPRYAHVRMHGVTPPHIYDLTPRESLFHGVEALRLNPVGGESAIFGRTGLLAHTYMLGPNGDSNGCVSFRDYQAFLRAYKNGDVKRLVVVAKVD